LLRAVVPILEVLLGILGQTFGVFFVYKERANLFLNHIFSNRLLTHNTDATSNQPPHKAEDNIAVCESDNQNKLLLSNLSQACISHFSNALPQAIFLFSHLISTHTCSHNHSIVSCNHSLIFSAAHNTLFLVRSYFK